MTQRRPRRSVRAAAVVVAIVVAAAVVVVGSVVVRRTVTYASDRGVPPLPGVRGATEIGALRQHPLVNGRDNGQSVRYGDRSIWVFGDTVVRDPWQFVSSTAASTPDLRAADGITVTSTDVFGDAGPRPTDLIPLTPAESAYATMHAASNGCTAATDPYCGAGFGLWPGAIVADPVRHRLLVFYVKLCRSTVPATQCSGEFGKAIGSGVASIDMTTHQVTRLIPAGAPVVDSVEGPDPTLFFPRTATYTASALLEGDTLYAYGDCDSRCHLARVPITAVGDRSRWEFYAGRDGDGGPEWTQDQDEAATSISAGSAGNSVYRVPALHAWLNVYLPARTNTMVAQVGASPAGPWSRAFPLLDTDDAGGGVNYAGFGHPEYAERGGLVQYVTYYQAKTYELRLARIELES